MENSFSKINTSNTSTFQESRNANAIEHSCEFVMELNGLSFINDSKATNINATVQSINSFNNNITLIIGGVDRDTDYSGLLNCESEKIKGIIYLGKTPERILRLINPKETAFFTSESIEDAIEISIKERKNSEIVLFSPSCPSYDVFDNYKNRGNKFKNYLKTKSESI